MPRVIDVAVSFADADFTKFALTVQRAARLVARNNLRLQGPITIGFRNFDQTAQERRTDPLPTRC